MNYKHKKFEKIHQPLKFSSLDHAIHTPKISALTNSSNQLPPAQAGTKIEKYEPPKTAERYIDITKLPQPAIAQNSTATNEGGEKRLTKRKDRYESSMKFSGEILAQAI